MRAQEFIKEEKVDEILPALGAAAGMVGRAALSGGSALARGAAAAGGAALRGLGNAAKTVGQQALSTAGRVAGQAIGQTVAGKNDPQQQQAAKAMLPKPGQMYNHPRFGPVKVLPLSSGEKGIKLDTTKALGHAIIVPPEEISL
jgi:hypothetical protein